MVDGVGKANPLQQQFSSNGIRLSELKQENELLFNYFTNAGYKEDQVIYSTDIEKLKDVINSQGEDDREKMTFKELRKAGFEGSRKDLRNLRNTMSSIQDRKLESNDEYLKEYVSENEVNYRKADGTLGVVEKKEDGRVISKFLINGDETKVSKKQEVYTTDDFEQILNEYYINGNENLVEKAVSFISSTKGEVTVTETEFLNGKRELPSRVVMVDNNSNKIITDYKYEDDKLSSKIVKNGQDTEITTYEYINGKQVEKSLVEQFTSDPNSFVSKEFERNEQGEITKLTIKYSGSKIGKANGYKTREIYSFDKPVNPESVYVDFDKIASGKIVTKLGAEGVEEKETLKNDDGKMNNVETVAKTYNLEGKEELEYYREFNGKPHRVEKDDKGNYYVTIEMPKGWNIQRLEYEFGVSKDSILKANRDSNGNALYHTNSKGVKYFYEDDKVRIVNPTKIQTKQRNGEEGDITFLYGEDAKLNEIIQKPLNNLNNNKANQNSRDKQRVEYYTPTIHNAPKISNEQKNNFVIDGHGGFVYEVEKIDSITIVEADSSMAVKKITKIFKSEETANTPSTPSTKNTRNFPKTSTSTKTVTNEFDKAGNLTKKVVETPLNITTTNYTYDSNNTHITKVETTTETSLTHHRRSHNVSEYSYVKQGKYNYLDKITYTKNGKPDGYLDFYSNGDLEKGEFYDENGKKIVKHYNRANNTVTQEIYDDRGWLNTQVYKDNKLAEEHYRSAIGAADGAHIKPGQTLKDILHES